MDSEGQKSGEGDARVYRRALFGLVGGGLAVYSALYLPQPILPFIGADLHQGPAVTSLIVSLAIITLALASLVHGHLADRLGRRRLMVGSLCLLVVPTIACALAPSFGWLLAARVAQGLLIPGIAVGSAAYAHETFPFSWVGAAFGVNIASNVSGGSAGRVLGGLIGAAWGWRAAFVASALLVVLGTVVAWRFLAEDRHRAAPGRAARGNLLRRPLVGMYITGGAMFFAFVGFTNYLTYRLASPPFRLPASVIGLFFLVYVVGMPLAPLAGSLSDRYGRRPVQGYALAALGLGVLLTGVPSVPLVLAGLLASCAGIFAANTCGNAYITEWGGEARAPAAAVYQFAFYTGGSLGGFLPGFLWQGFGWLGVQAACLAALALAGLSLWRLCESGPLEAQGLALRGRLQTTTSLRRR